MIDLQTRKPIRVSTDGTAGPYIMVPIDQFPRLRQKLDEHGVTFWEDSDAISLNGQPAIVIVNLGLTGDARKVQAILDIPG